MQHYIKICNYWVKFITETMQHYIKLCNYWLIFITETLQHYIKLYNYWVIYTTETLILFNIKYLDCRILYVKDQDTPLETCTSVLVSECTNRLVSSALVFFLSLTSDLLHEKEQTYRIHLHCKGIHQKDSPVKSL